MLRTLYVLLQVVVATSAIIDGGIEIRTYRVKNVTVSEILWTLDLRPRKKKTRQRPHGHP